MPTHITTETDVYYCQFLETVSRRLVLHNSDKTEHVIVGTLSGWPFYYIFIIFMVILARLLTLEIFTK